MEDLLFPHATTYASPPPTLASPLPYPAAVAARVLSTESIPAAALHEAMARECVVGDVAVGAPEATIAPPAAYTGDRFDISRIELSPSVDVQVVGQWERAQDMNEEVKRDGGELAELEVVAVLEPPALSPEPHIGSVLDSFQHQRREYALSGDAPLNRSPLHPPPVDEQPQQQQQLDTHDSSDERKAVDDSFSSPLPLRHTDPQPAVTAPYIPAEQHQPAHMAARARGSAYTYSQPALQPYGRATQPIAQRETSYAPQYATVPIACPLSHQAQPFMYPAAHHPSMLYYHTTDNSMPAQSQPTATHLNSLHSYIHRHRQLELQRNEIVSRYTQLEATKDQRPVQDHALLVQHLEHCHQQVQADMQSTEWMVGGGAPLITTADVPRIHSYSHAELVRHHRQQEQQRQQQRQQQNEEDEQEEDEYSEGEAAELEALLAQSCEIVEQRQRKSSREESDRTQPDDQEPAPERDTRTAAEKTKKRKSNKRKRNPDATPHSISAYIVSPAQLTAQKHIAAPPLMR